MITLIEIDGFKTFKDFKVELAPFQVIVGPNGSGKSNLFDALHLLSRLADTDLASAFQEVRGDASELFTLLPNGQHTDRISMAVEMLVDQKVHDSGGGEVELIGEAVALKKDATVKYRRLRYELEVTLGTDTYGLDRFYITHESLKSIPYEKDNWYRKYKPSYPDNWLPGSEEKVFITTELTNIAVVNSRSDNSPQELNALMILQHPDEQGRIKRFYAAEVQRTVLSRVSEIDYRHAFAAREALRSFKFLHLNPEALRQPSSFKAPSSLSPDGGNLPATLARLQAEDHFALSDISLDMANLIPGLLDIEIDEDKARNQYIIRARDEEQILFSAQVLSEGTLRLLALATLRNDAQFHGVLCLEEPENGVHPLHLKNMVHLLREMATDLKNKEQMEEPLRQVLITTHSPLFISQPEVIDALLFAIKVVHVEPESSGNPSLQITRMIPVITPNTQFQYSKDGVRDRAIEAYTIDQVRDYLDNGVLDEALAQLQKARTTLNEGR